MLKTIRVVVAAAFFACTAFLFVDFREIGAKHLAEGLLYLQFMPSLLGFLTSAAFGTAGCLIVLMLSLLFGRVYCSTICPLGTLQDGFSRLGRSKMFRFGRKKQSYSFSKPHTTLRLAILGLTVVLFVGGSGLMLNILDPFSNFGRIFSNLVRPVVLAINNLSVPVAEQLGSHVLYRVQWPAIAPLSICIALAMLLLTGWLGLRRGRLYCNTLCPVGTLLGLCSKIAPYRVHMDQVACRSCGLCERVCKAECIDYRNKKLDTTRCVACYNCINVCPDEALSVMERSARKSAGNRRNNTRRKFIIGLTTGTVCLLTARTGTSQPSVIVQSRPTTIPEKRTSVVSPPGSRSISHFTSRCIACHLCVSACPSRILVPTTLEYGLSGMMQPQMLFRTGHCNFDCTTCSEVCPSDAIQPLTKETKQRTQVGIAKFIKKNCVVYTDSTNCGACSEHCPTKAVKMIPYKDNSGRKLVIPEVSPTICVGCGGCEHACPTRPFKAIYVDGNPVHKIAEKPVIQQLELPTAETDDFPF